MPLILRAEAPAEHEVNIIITRASAFKDDFYSQLYNFIHKCEEARAQHQKLGCHQRFSKRCRVQKGYTLVTVEAVAGKPLKRLDVHEKTQRGSPRANYTPAYMDY